MRQIPLPASQLKKAKKSFWLKQLHTWHWTSSAISLIGLLLFAVTGITLNHAGEIEGKPVVEQREERLPEALLPLVQPPAESGEPAQASLPAELAAWVEDTFKVRAGGPAEWSADEIYLALPQPGGDGWVAIDRLSGDVQAEITDRGWISYLNDLHKGRNSGTVWKWFIDIFAVACVIFAITGLLLLKLHAAKRPSTWPLVALGLVIPALLAILFIH